MDERIEVYLDRLHTRLVKRWPAKDADDAVQEIRIHLSDSMGQLVAEGRGQAEAAVEALRRIGSDRLLAENLIRVRSGIDQRSVWRIAWVPSLLLLLMLMLPFALESGTPGTLEIILRTLAWLSCIFPLALVYASWRTRRMLVYPLAAAIGASAVFGFAYMLLLGPVGVTEYSRQQRASMIRNSDGYTRHMESQIAEARLAVAGRALPKDGANRLQAPIQSIAVNETSLAFIPFSYETSRTPTVYVSPVTDAAEAKKLWQANGKAYLAKITGELQAQKKAIEEWRHYKLGGSVVAGSLKYLLGFSLYAIALITMVNGLVPLLERGRRRVLERRWRPERLT